MMCSVQVCECKVVQLAIIILTEVYVCLFWITSSSTCEIFGGKGGVGFSSHTLTVLC